MLKHGLHLWMERKGILQDIPGIEPMVDSLIRRIAGTEHAERPCQSREAGCRSQGAGGHVRGVGGHFGGFSRRGDHTADGRRDIHAIGGTDHQAGRVVSQADQGILANLFGERVQLLGLLSGKPAVSGLLLELIGAHELFFDGVNDLFAMAVACRERIDAAEHHARDLGRVICVLGHAGGGVRNGAQMLIVLAQADMRKHFLAELSPRGLIGADPIGGVTDQILHAFTGGTAGRGELDGSYPEAGFGRAGGIERQQLGRNSVDG